MAKFEKQVKGNFDVIVNNIHEDIMSSGISMNLVDESNYKNDLIKMAVRVYDKYFMRNGNRASLNLTIVGDCEDNVFISAIGAGGGSGVFFNYSLGAESELVEIVENSLNQQGL